MIESSNKINCNDGGLGFGFVKDEFLLVEIFFLP